jgi:hypothetical protein
MSPRDENEDEPDGKWLWFNRVIGLVQTIVFGLLTARIATSDGLPMGWRVFFLAGSTFSMLWGIERVVNRYWTHGLALRI